MESEKCFGSTTVYQSGSINTHYKDYILGLETNAIGTVEVSGPAFLVWDIRTRTHYFIGLDDLIKLVKGNGEVV